MYVEEVQLDWVWLCAILMRRDNSVCFFSNCQQNKECINIIQLVTMRFIRFKNMCVCVHQHFVVAKKSVLLIFEFHE